MIQKRQNKGLPASPSPDLRLYKHLNKQQENNGHQTKPKQ